MFFFILCDVTIKSENFQSLCILRYIYSWVCVELFLTASDPALRAVGLNSLRPSDAYICAGNLTIIDSDNSLSPRRRQAIIWTSAEILLIRTLGTNLKRNSYIFIQENAFKNVVCAIAAILSRLQCVKRHEQQEAVPFRNDIAIYLVS